MTDELIRIGQVTVSFLQFQSTHYLVLQFEKNNKVEIERAKKMNNS